MRRQQYSRSIVGGTMEESTWVLSFYECVKLYYEGSTEVRCLTKDDCDSDEEYVEVGGEQGSMDPIPYGGRWDLPHRIWKANASLPLPLWTCKPTMVYVQLADFL